LQRRWTNENAPEGALARTAVDGSERNVVVHVVEAGRRLLRRGRRRARRRGRAGRRGAATRLAVTHALAAAEQLHLVGDDLGGVLLDAVLVGPLARLQPAFDVDRATLLQVLAGNLGQAVVEDHA